MDTLLVLFFVRIPSLFKMGSRVKRGVDFGAMSEGQC